MMPFNRMLDFISQRKFVAVLSEANARITELEQSNEELRKRIAEESRRAIDAIDKLRAAQDRADEFARLYAQESEDHKRTLKAEANWYAMSTSTRLPIHDGVGPTRPPVQASAPIEFPARIRASDAARINNAHVLADIEEKQRAELKRMGDQLPELDRDNGFSPEESIKRLESEMGVSIDEMVGRNTA